MRVSAEKTWARATRIHNWVAYLWDTFHRYCRKKAAAKPMKKFFPIFLLILFSAIAAQAQTTSVSGTITDSGGQAWANGTYSFTFLPSPSNPTANYFQGGVAFNKNQTISGALSAVGSLTSVAVPDNNTITPAGSQWTVQVCPAATATNGCYRVNLTITGASQTITSSVVPPAIVVNMAFVPFYSAYQDSEVLNGHLGQAYFNLTTGTVRVCTFPVCSWVSLGTASASITGCSTTGGVAYQNGTLNTLTCAPAVTEDNSTQAVTMTATADTVTALAVNPHSVTQSHTPFRIHMNGTDNCDTSGTGLQSTYAMCIEGGTYTDGMYESCNSSSGANECGNVFVDTSDPMHGFGYWSERSGTGSYGLDIGQITGAVSSQLDFDISGNINLYPYNGTSSIYWGSFSPSNWSGRIVPSTGEVEAGLIPTHQTGFFSIVDGSTSFKVSLKNPGTMTANYNFNYPITAGTVGQVLASQGGGTTPMTWRPVQGTDTNLLSSGTISGTAAPLCTDANGGATTSGCPTSSASSVSQTSAATNYGTNLGAQTLIASVSTTGPIWVTAMPIQTLVGSGCSGGTNGTSVIFAWTAPGGTAKTLTGSIGQSFSGNGVLDDGTSSDPGTIPSDISSSGWLLAKAGTSISYTTSSTLNSTGCVTVPQYTVYAKALY